jgi:hypothetical protein
MPTYHHNALTAFLDIQPYINSAAHVGGAYQLHHDFSSLPTRDADLPEQGKYPF